MKTIIILSLLVLLTMNISAQQNSINIIPKPQVVEPVEGVFLISKSTKILFNEQSKQVADYLKEHIKSWNGSDLILEEIGKSNSDKNIIKLRIIDSDEVVGDEGYTLKCDASQILISAHKENGLFYGVQSLKQLFPTVSEQHIEDKIIIPAVNIIDYPRFSWRGLNLDCCRHFMSKDFVKRYIDLLAFHKMNVLHWHLTEDQGWRIEIKKYPELTEHGAWRKYDDGSVYGGFYTQEEIKEVVEYAASRFITVVPEIEMPGHSMAAISTYPHLSCTGGPFDVGTLWGIYKDVYCAGNEETFTFLEAVLTEVIDLFPGKYIHIGGDEAPKDRWEKCEKCQALIKSENLYGLGEIQSYFIKRMEKFINSKGKEIIGWDEILEGGLAPGATVQSWRGTKGAVEAAKMGHDVIVSPTTHCYYDYPIEVTDVPKIYSFNPVPEELSVEEAKHVLGSEGNMWTEYAPQEFIDHRLFPRLAALSEVMWLEKEKKNYTDFESRMMHHYSRLERMGVNYSFEISPLEFINTSDSSNRSLNVQINQLQENLELFFTLDGSEPTTASLKNSEPINIAASTTLKVGLYHGEKKVGPTIERLFTVSKSLNKKVKLTYPYKRYTGGGDKALTDGARGTDYYRDGSWQGFHGTDFEAILDLEEVSDISKITIGFTVASSSLVFLPEYVEVFVPNRNQSYESVGKASIDFSLKDPTWTRKDFIINLGKVSARYIKIFAKNPMKVPEWHPAYGGIPWLMIDEIIVE